MGRAGGAVVGAEDSKGGELMNFILATDNAHAKMRAAWDMACAILQHGQRVKVTVQEFKPTRSADQNAKMWAMLHDISRQVEWFVDGRKQRLSPDEWKHILTAGLKKHQRIAQGIDGGFVILGTKTSRMTVAEMTDLIELANAFGAEHGVVWSDGMA